MDNFQIKTKNKIKTTKMTKPKQCYRCKKYKIKTPPKSSRINIFQRKLTPAPLSPAPGARSSARR